MVRPGRGAFTFPVRPPYSGTVSIAPVLTIGQHASTPDASTNFVDQTHDQPS